jgi:transcriptional regulator with XRE-family HTH domain
MNQTDFGKLIASLRREHEDEQGAPWTQAKLAQEANLAANIQLLNEDLISNIERGKRNPDRRILVALATSLQLTSSERKEFFLAASGIDTKDIARQENTPQEVYSHMVEYIKELYLPATVINAYCDVLAVNHPLLELLEFPSASGMVPEGNHDQPHRFNLLRFIFSENGSQHFRKLMGEGYRDFAFSAVSVFRTFSLSYRSTEYFHALLSDLRKSYLFRRYWSDIYFSEMAHQPSNVCLRMHSSRWGASSMFFTDRTAFTTAGELHLTVFIPTDSKTASIFDRVAQQIDKPTIYHLTPWPNNQHGKHIDAHT